MNEARSTFVAGEDPGHVVLTPDVGLSLLRDTAGTDGLGDPVEACFLAAAVVGGWPMAALVVTRTRGGEMVRGP
jgi:hypothetical protein